jgi:pyruvate/2-oxoacid:ferredoxin oxidoreductase alpha subunit
MKAIVIIALLVYAVGCALILVYPMTPALALAVIWVTAAIIIAIAWWRFAYHDDWR